MSNNDKLIVVTGATGQQGGRDRQASVGARVTRAAP